MPKKIHRRRDADPKEGLKKYGATTFADPVNKKYPIDTPGSDQGRVGLHPPGQQRREVHAARGPDDQVSREAGGEDSRRGTTGSRRVRGTHGSGAQEAESSGTVSKRGAPVRGSRVMGGAPKVGRKRWRRVFPTALLPLAWASGGVRWSWRRRPGHRRCPPSSSPHPCRPARHTCGPPEIQAEQTGLRSAPRRGRAAWLWSHRQVARCSSCPSSRLSARSSGRRCDRHSQIPGCS